MFELELNRFSKGDISSVKIADFGLSDFYRPGATLKTNCGSISYLAPEVFRGTSNAGPPLDVWSLGVILYAIICRKLPFEGCDLSGVDRPRENVIRNRILQCQYAENTRINDQAKDLMHRMLNLDPNDRASIPEIFNHPWLRGNSGLAMHFDSLVTNEEVSEQEQLPSVSPKPRKSENIEKEKTKRVSGSSMTRKSSQYQSILPKQRGSPPKTRSKHAIGVESKNMGKSDSKKADTAGKIVAHREAILPAEGRSPHSRPGPRRISTREAAK